MKKIIYFLSLILLIIPISYSFTSSSSLNWASYKYVENNFCKQGGECNLSTLNVINQTVININSTGDLDVAGDSRFINNVTMEKSLFVADNVGIGTTDPNTSLEVSTGTAYDGVIAGAAFVGNWVSNSNAMFAHKDIKDTPTSYALIQANDGEVYLNSAVGQDLNFMRGNSYLGTWTNTGLGIGTSSPVFKTHILTSDNDAGLLIQRNSGTTGVTTGLYFKTSTDTTVGYASSGIVLEDNGGNNAGADLHIVRKILPLAGTVPGVADRIMSFYDNMVEVLNDFNIVGDLRATTLNQSTLKLPNDNGVSSTGLKGYWSMNKNANDYSGEGNDGTVTGATLTEGRFGNAYDFDGEDDIISINKDYRPYGLFSDVWTFCEWVNIKDITREQIIFSMGTWDLHSCRYDLDTTKFECYSGKGGVSSHLYSIETPIVGEWYHLCEVQEDDGSGLGDYILYVNGVAEDIDLDVNSTISYYNSFNQLGAGRGSAHVLRYFWNGTIDEVMFFNRSLSSNEVKSLYESNKEHISQDAYHMKGQDVNPNSDDGNSIGSSIKRWLKGWFSSLDVEGNITGNQIYGGMWYHNHTATTFSFTDADTWYPLFFTNATDLNGFSYVGGFGVSSNLTAQVSGKYQASYMGIGSGQNNHVYLTTILIDGIDKPECGNHHKMAAGGDVITQSGVCIISINAGQTIEVASQDMGGTGDGEYYGGNINLVRIGDI